MIIPKLNNNVIQNDPEIEVIPKFLRELRLFVNNICNHDCKYGSGKRFCHSKKDSFVKPLQIDVEQIEGLFDVFVQWGFTKLRICGMEPTLHSNLPEIVEAAKICGFKTVKMTTNGSKLSQVMRSLADKELDGLTVSLHTLNPSKFQFITGGSIEPILESLELAREYQIPTKINCVIQKGVNDDIDSVLQYAWTREFIPKIYQLLWQPTSESDYSQYFIPIEEVLEPYLAEMRCVKTTEFLLSQRKRYRYQNKQNMTEFY